jgi:hypothetical protein
MIHVPKSGKKKTVSDYFIKYNDDIKFISFCSHNNVPETVPPEIRKLMQDNIDGNKDELVRESVGYSQLSTSNQCFSCHWHCPNPPLPQLPNYANPRPVMHKEK